MNRVANARPRRPVASLLPPVLPATSRASTIKADLVPIAPVAMMAPIRVLIADDHAVLRDGLRAMLASQHDVRVVGDVSSGEDALRMVDDLNADVLLLDYSMPGMSGLEVMQQLRARQAPVKTILLTAGVERPDAVKMLQSGVRGIVLKSAPGELLFKSIRRVHAGEVWVGRELIGDIVTALSRTPSAPEPQPRPDFGLTEREYEILRLVVNGDTNKSIAEQLSLREDTVKHHLTSIFNKTGASTRLELAVFALHHRLLG